MINPLFGYVKLNAAGREKAENVARYFTNLLEEIEAIIPKGQELSIVRTKLEEASFYAKKALVNDEANHRIAELLYVIEFTYNGKNHARSYNESFTHPWQTLDKVEFKDRAEAEKEATLQQQSMGLGYKYTVAVKE